MQFKVNYTTKLYGRYLDEFNRASKQLHSVRFIGANALAFLATVFTIILLTGANISQEKWLIIALAWLAGCVSAGAAAFLVHFKATAAAQALSSTVWTVTDESLIHAAETWKCVYSWSHFAECWDTRTFIIFVALPPSLNSSNRYPTALFAIPKECLDAEQLIELRAILTKNTRFLPAS